MRLVLTLVVLVSANHAKITIPGEKVDKKTLTTLGIKTLDWQQENSQSQHEQIEDGHLATKQTTYVKPSYEMRHNLQQIIAAEQHNVEDFGQYVQSSSDLVESRAVPEGFYHCPEDQTGQFPSAVSCNQFWNCWKGRGVLQNCAPGTLFNPYTFECDFASKVKCLQQTKFEAYTQDSLVRSHLKTGCPSGFSGVVPHHDDCSKFINCNHGKENVMECGPGTLFNLKINACDYPYNAECASWSSKFGEADDESSAGSGVDKTKKVQCASDATGLYPHPWDCSKFLNCANGQTFVQDCGPGTHFNPESSVCDFPHNVKCETGDEHGAGKIDVRVQPDTLKCPLHAEGVYAHPNFCTKYVNCYRGRTEIKECPSGLMYDAESNGCDSAFNVDCSRKNLNSIFDFGGSTSQSQWNQQQTGTSWNQGNVNRGWNQQGQSNQGGNQQGQNRGNQDLGSGTLGYQGWNQQEQSSSSKNQSQGSQSWSQQGQNNPFWNKPGQNYGPQGQGWTQQGTQTWNQDGQSYGSQSNTLEGHSWNQQGQDYNSQSGALGNQTWNQGSQSGTSTWKQPGQNDGSASPSQNNQNQQGGTLGSHGWNQQGQSYIPQGGTSTKEINQNQQGSNSNSYGWSQQGQNYGPQTGTPVRQSNQGNILGSQDWKQQGQSGTSGSQSWKQPEQNYNQQGTTSSSLNWNQQKQNQGQQGNYLGNQDVNQQNHGLQGQQTNSGWSQQGQHFLSQGSTSSTQGWNQQGQNQGQQVKPGWNQQGQNFPSQGSTSSTQGWNQQGQNQGQQVKPGWNQQGQNFPSQGSTSSSQSWNQQSQNQGQQVNSGWNPQGQNFPSQGSTSSTQGWKQQGQNQGKQVNSGWSQQGQDFPSQSSTSSTQGWNQQGQSQGQNQGQQVNSGWSQQGQNFPSQSGTSSNQSWNQQGQTQEQQVNLGWNQQGQSQGQNQGQQVKPGWSQQGQNFPSQGSTSSTQGWNQQGQSQSQGQPGWNQQPSTSWNQNPNKDQNKTQQGQFGTATWNLEQQSSNWQNQNNGTAWFEDNNQGQDIDQTWSESQIVESKNSDKQSAKGQKETKPIANLAQKDRCSVGAFHCTPTDCIPKSMHCDGIKDCSNGLDERNCEKILKEFVTNQNHILAVREKERFFNVTVLTCAKACLESKSFQCRSFSFRRDDGACFLSDANVGVSGSLILSYPYDYYELSALTMNCTNLHRCPNEKCISKKQICDGVNDCGDRTDEKGCSAQAFGYQIRLAGGGGSHEGRIEINAFGQSGYVCDDKFGLRNADVVCKELGFPLGALEVKSNSFFAKDLKNQDILYLMDDVTCLGNETSIRDCDFNGWGVSNCESQEVVGVICKTPQETCPKDHWKCDTVPECLPLVFVCDGVYDCTDESDESAQHCDAPTELRLVGGSNKFEGRLEVRHYGIWGSVCDDDFNDDAAKVVCKYFGYPGKAVAKKNGGFGPSTGPIWLDQVFCQGNESTLEQCVHWNWGEHNCEHSEDVGIVCSGADAPVVESERKARIESVPENVFVEQCGLRKDAIFLTDDKVHFRVVGGAIAQKGDYPWQASLRIKNQGQMTHWCGAVVITKKFILTAAHCLQGFSKGAYIVVAGDYNTDEDEGTEQEAYIEEFYLHEQFRVGQKMNNDVALIKLKGAGFTFTKDVQPICLPSTDVEYETGKNCTISGFGSIQSGKSSYSHDMRAAYIPLIAQDVCKMPHVYGNTITDGMVCAGSLDEGADACEGDSGGPLACLHDGYYTLYGLTSWGHHCGHANKPGVYVRVAHYRKWIDDMIFKHV